MDQQQLENVTRQVLQQLFVEVEASGRHVHLTGQQARTLFGHDLTPHRPLSQPGQFLARERVQVIGPRGSFSDVAVLGPARSAGQVEISMTDGRQLGLQPPVRLSGDIAGTPGAVLQGPAGRVTLEQGVIVARRHLHLTPESAACFGVQDRQVVQLQVFTRRPLTFGDVVVRVSPDFASCAHLDYDEANACGMEKGDLGRIVP